MRHARFAIARLSLEGIDLPVRTASLLVAEVDDGVDPQWECVAYGIDDGPLAQQVYAVDVVTGDGRRFHGPAALVRSVEGAHVLRGSGPLQGVEPADLDRAT